MRGSILTTNVEGLVSTAMMARISNAPLPLVLMCSPTLLRASKDHAPRIPSQSPQPHYTLFHMSLISHPILPRPAS